MKINDGILVVNKPVGVTSHDVVDFIRKLFGIKKVGHAGTLDPFAQGVLVILVGKATKRQSEFLRQDKEYITTLFLGATSTTDDIEGSIKYKKIDKIPSLATIRRTINLFIGQIKQIPPVYSAVKIKGKKAYELARAGQTPSLKPKRVQIKEIEILSYEWPKLKIRVVCSSGTYIRALARDIGKTLSCGAYLETLIRIRSGKLTLKQAITVKESFYGKNKKTR
jgi:tRNA pseudouridine55 synthase